MEHGYHYALAFSRFDGSSVGQVAVTVDWEPACECVRFEALRRRRQPPAPPQTTRVEPVWHPVLGEPYVGGFRVGVASTEQQMSPDAIASEFTTAYFDDLVQPALRQLVEEKRAEPAETLKYHVVAFPRPTEAPAPSRFGGEEVVPRLVFRQRALDRYRRDALAMGEPQPDELPLFVHATVIQEATALAERASGVETGGVLVGHLHEDVDRPELFVEVTAQIPARSKGSSTSLAFTSQIWTDVRAALDLRRRDELMLGWWHSHPVKSWCAVCPVERQKVCVFREGFLSADDRVLHRTVFPRAFSVALVLSDVADAGITYRAFGWRQGLIRPRAFHLLNASRVSHLTQALFTPAGGSARAERVSTVQERCERGSR